MPKRGRQHLVGFSLCFVKRHFLSLTSNIPGAAPNDDGLSSHEKARWVLAKLTCLMADSVGTESARHVRQVDAQRVASQTPLDLLAEFGCLEAMEALVKETLPSQEKLADALRMASAHGQMESIRALLGLPCLQHDLCRFWPCCAMPSQLR